MDKQWIEQTFEGLKVRFDYPANYEPSIVPEAWIENVGQVTNLIAAQHNLELARARSEKTALLPCGHPASVADDDGCAMCRLVAQVAMMEKYAEHLPSCAVMSQLGWKVVLPCDCGFTDALSAAPKVWRMPGRTSKYYDLEVVADDAPDEFRQLLIARGMFAPWDVIVFLPPGEQPTESEQEATDGTH